MSTTRNYFIFPYLSQLMYNTTAVLFWFVCSAAELLYYKLRQHDSNNANHPTLLVNTADGEKWYTSTKHLHPCFLLSGSGLTFLPGSHGHTFHEAADRVWRGLATYTRVRTTTAEVPSLSHEATMYNNSYCSSAAVVVVPCTH